MTFKDQLNRSIYLKGVPKRIVSLVPSQTELLCDLGLKGSLVGITKFCVHPCDVKAETTVVGGTKQIHLDKLKALRPDIILCNKEENTKAIVKACELISVVHVSDILSINDSLELIGQYGEIFNKERKAAVLIDTIKNEIEEFQNFIKNKPVLKVAYFIWRSPWMVAANSTFINYLLELNRFENIYKDKERYPEIEFKALDSGKKVDLVLLSSEPFPFKESHKKEIKQYYPNATIVLADGEMFSWFGSRLLKAFKYFKMLRLNL
ncbi:helical backbone metal receptor [Tamlana sp. 2201CG12-4]|uniref:ABC transporter substrate-binding protein n=1 Tax=Tamlana sp. 2201CG12-4 TaxID=3112582 RepID=UPI002DBBE623|nr:helical backbone metal receptor [Tamlana sp. 2201CG12-4]MEC3907535.1 helical backbone metal receptor [Tamlana sp. 2201CG12-4]